MKIFLADRQDITRAGLMYLIERLPDADYKYIEDKGELLLGLHEYPDSIVILDYTLFDINDGEELVILSQRFKRVHWILFSEDLSLDFVRYLIASGPEFSIVMKESPLSEIKTSIDYAIRKQRFISQRMAEMLLAPVPQMEERVKLTKTETEILKDIALGMTTKEIAEKRFSSFHTINTHRKNIFRKLSVNNVHEATKYALRAGLIDSAEYYI
ncbi:transcriptional regulator, LuxR family [Prevotella sp. DNF00663]|uniref:response regulator transcription factor n=1 Tax=unclassified Prevotella TaxID=2638335 RepID=UPI0005129F0D|nr:MULTISPECIES: response regulator transcription factor [unclassified Prevotella]KGI61434.1 transcriptional regulator [Prevotella sp. S7 MS 2]KXB85213.1 transcriptional regulator, LuxR family [Prevotella sp. DNF00663]